MAASLRDGLAAYMLVHRALAVLFVALVDVLLRPCFRARPPPQRVAVVGGGIAGAGAAFALRRAGVAVDLFEAGAAAGGNAKTHAWADGVRTGLSVLAWPRAYFRNYAALLRALGVPTAPVELPFFIARADGESFAHGAPGVGLAKRYAAELAKWARMVEHVRAVNAAFAPRDGGPAPSLYSASFVNPFNAVPLRALARVWGCGGDAFWQDVIAPLYASSFLTTAIDSVPAVVLPIISDLIPADASRTVSMDSWAREAGSADVFAGLLAGVTVHAGARVERAAQRADGRWALSVAAAGGGHAASEEAGFDAVIFACGAPAAARALRGAPLDVLPTAVLLRGISYCAGPAFERGVVHSHAPSLPAAERAALLRGFANYIVAHAGKARRYENTFILSSWAAQPPASRGTPRLVTYDARDPVGLAAHAAGGVENKENHPHLSVANLAAAQLLRAAQGRRGLYFCGSFATPGNGHDLSFTSGLAVAAALGAPYPFADDAGAAADFARLRRLMGV
jgi:predicted NAD/FAD-binding protein